MKPPIHGTREHIQVRTDYSLEEIGHTPFLFLSNHLNEYDKQVKNAIYHQNPDHYWNETFNNKELTVHDTNCGIPDIKKIFYSAVNLVILARNIHKRILLCVEMKYKSWPIQQIKTIYPAISDDRDSMPVQIFSGKNLQPFMDRSISLYGENKSDNIQRQIDALNFIV